MSGNCATELNVLHEVPGLLPSTEKPFAKRPSPTSKKKKGSGIPALMTSGHCGYCCDVAGRCTGRFAGVGFLAVSRAPLSIFMTNGLGV